MEDNDGASKNSSPVSLFLFFASTDDLVEKDGRGPSKEIELRNSVKDAASKSSSSSSSCFCRY